jgi:aromatic ring-cleaving dioxygenase
VRQLAQRWAAIRGLAMVGTPKTIADEMEEWLETDASDGFTIMFPYLPGGSTISSAASCRSCSGAACSAASTRARRCARIWVAAAGEPLLRPARRSRPNDMSEIENFHAHVYYDAPTRAQALKLCEAAGQNSASRSGGCTTIRSARIRAAAASSPSARSSSPTCLLAGAQPRGLTVFTHAQTGNALKDHTDHVIWLGPSETLKLDQFR